MDKSDKEQTVSRVIRTAFEGELINDTDILKAVLTHFESTIEEDPYLSKFKENTVIEDSIDEFLVC